MRLKQIAYGDKECVSWRPDGSITVSSYVPSDSDVEMAEKSRRLGLLEESRGGGSGGGPATADESSHSNQQYFPNKETLEVIRTLNRTRSTISIDPDGFEATFTQWEFDSLTCLLQHYPFLVCVGVSFFKKTLVLLRTYPWQVMTLVEGYPCSKEGDRMARKALVNHRLDQRVGKDGYTPTLRSLKAAAAGRINAIPIEERLVASRDDTASMMRAPYFWIDCLAYGGNVDALLFMHKALCSDAPHAWDRGADDHNGTQAVGYGAKVLLDRCCHWNVWKVVRHIMLCANEASNMTSPLPLFFHDVNANTDLEADLSSTYPLHITGLRDGFDTALVLLVHGADIGAHDKKISCYETPLACACRNNSPDVTELLLDCGADVDDGDSCWDTTPLASASLGQMGRAVECAELLIARNADLDREDGLWQRTPLTNALLRDDLELAELLVRAGCSLKGCFDGKLPPDTATGRFLQVECRNQGCRVPEDEEDEEEDE